MTLAFGLSSKEVKVKKRKKVISFTEGLGALESQMLVYKKVCKGPSVNGKARSLIALFGLFSCSLGGKPSSEAVWDQELRPQWFPSPTPTKAISKVSATSGGRGRLSGQDLCMLPTQQL